MNKKRILIFLGLILIIIIALFLFNTMDILHDRSQQEKVKEQEEKVAKVEIERKVEEIKQLQKHNPEKAKELAEQLFQSLPAKMRRYYDWGFNAGIEDVVFYGRVVDQYGEPVDQVRVDFEVGGRYLAAGSGRGALLTDSDGRFHLRGKGGSLSVGPLKHPEIDGYRYRELGGSVARGKVGFWGYQHVKGDNDLIWSDYTEDNPYLFEVWRKMPGNLAKKLIIIEKSLLKFSCTGEVYTLDLFNYPKMKISGEVEGQLRVRYYCKEKMNSRDYGDWTVEIEAVNGGIQETNAIYLNEAPESGYEPVYRIDMEVGESTYQRRVEKRLFFQAERSRFYGSLEIDFDPYTDDVPSIFLVSKLNPTGSRVLVSE